MKHKPKSIALIDDDAIYLYGVKRIIKDAKLPQKVLTFSDGQEALDYFLEHLSNIKKLPDVIFLDLNMPVMDGWQFIKEYDTIKTKMTKDIRIYITSTSKNPEDLLRAQSLEVVTDYIVKPLTEEKLVAAINNSSKR